MSCRSLYQVLIVVPEFGMLQTKWRPVAMFRIRLALPSLKKLRLCNIVSNCLLMASRKLHSPLSDRASLPMPTISHRPIS